jgi:phage terminase Nu1 subunit (DNA packaging protein)
VQYIGELIKSGDLPKPIKQNCHDVVKACQKIIENIRDQHSGEKSDIEAETLRLTKARADKADLEVRELKRELVPYKDVQDASFEKFRMVRDQFMNIPSRLSPILAAEKEAKKVRELLDKEIRQVLEALSGDLNERKT